MTVAALTPSVSYAEDGVTLGFPAPFRYLDPTHLLVTRTSAAGVQTTLAYGTAWSATAGATDAGGTVTLMASIAGSTLTIQRKTPRNQSTDYVPNDRFPAETHEAALDRAMLIDQEQDVVTADLNARSIMVPRGETAPPLAAASARANKFLGFDAGGNPVMLSGTGNDAALRADLGEKTGSALSGFTHSGSPGPGTVARKLKQSVALVDDPYNAAEDGLSNDAAAITAAASAAKAVLVSGTALGNGTLISDLIDTRFKGQGSLASVYRKWVIPDESPAAEFWKADLSPDRHLRQFNTNPTPNVTLMGDSISTYFANSLARGDMLANVIEHELMNQKPNGIVFRNRAIGGTTYATAMGVAYQSYIPWYAGDAATAWITLVGNEHPDLIILSWQMNYDAPGGVKNDFKVQDLDNVINWIGSTFSPIPSIVVCTGFVPTPASALFPQGQAGQESRDGAAGAIRQYAKWKRLSNGQEIGLIDFHRMACRARDGFDPVSTCIAKIGTTAINAVVSGANKIATGDTLCHDWKIQVAANLSSMAVNDYLLFGHGYGADDFFQIIKKNNGTATFAAYCGTLSSNIPLYSQDFAFDMTQTGPFVMTVEKIENIVTIYTDQDSQFGTFTPPAFSGKIVGLGGDFYPRVEAHGGGGSWLSGANFYYGVPRLNVPSIKDSLLFGRESQGAISTYGGSGYNHPGGYAATHIYRPLVQAIDWHRYVPQSGSLAISSAQASATVTFPFNEPDTAYTLEVSFEGISPGQTWACATKNIGSAIINFAAATSAATTAKWRLRR